MHSYPRCRILPFISGSLQPSQVYPWIYLTTSNVMVVLVVKNPPANSGDVGDVGSIPGLGRSPGGGHSNPLQHSYLENPMDKGAWQATVHRVGKSQTWLKWLSPHTHTHKVTVRHVTWTLRHSLGPPVAILAHLGPRQQCWPPTSRWSSLQAH